MFYYRPIVQTDRARPDEAHVLAGGCAWFSHVERIARNEQSAIIQASDVPRDILENLTSARAPICGLDMASAKIMAILNVTPDSFSDGGQHYGFTRAVEQANLMIAEGADLLDIGGESTRPGADFVESDVEITRTRPVIEALKAAGVVTPLSIDTRKGIERDLL